MPTVYRCCAWAVPDLSGTVRALASLDITSGNNALYFCVVLRRHQHHQELLSATLDEAMSCLRLLLTAAAHNTALAALDEFQGLSTWVASGIMGS